MTDSNWIYDWNADPENPISWSDFEIWDATLALHESELPEWSAQLKALGIKEARRLDQDWDLAGVQPILIDSPSTLEPAELRARLERDRPVLLSDPRGLANASEVEQLCRALAIDSVPFGWTGGNRLGLALANAVTALRCGARFVLTSFFGSDDMVATDQLLVNLVLLGARPRPERSGVTLRQMVEQASDFLDYEILANYPVLGEDAFRTGTGVHAAAIIKAEKTGNIDLADQIYSGVPANWFGYEQIIEVGPMAGASNVVHWLKKQGYEPTPDRVERMLQEAKKSNAVLSDEVLHKLASREFTKS